MDVSITITTQDEMTRFIKFFSKSGLQVHPSNPEAFVELLYTTIVSGSISQSWLSSDVFSEYVNILLSTYSEDEFLVKFIDGVRGYYNDSVSSMKLQPTEHFKIICGTEALDSNGLISRKEALDFIMYQISIRNITVKDNTIFMDDYLNNTFNTNLHKVRKDELLDLIDTLFLA